MSFNHENQLVVSVPRGCSRKAAKAFLSENRDWIITQDAKLPPVLRISDYLNREPFLSFGGRRVAVSIHEVTSGRGYWIYDAERAEGLFQVPGGEQSDEILLGLVRKLASRELPKRTSELAKIHGFSPGRISVRDQNTRWGSCSGNESISLNWRLLLVEPAVQDYVILHELVHLRHLNHSPRFYRLLDEVDSNRIENERKLTQKGSLLMRVGRRKDNPSNGRNLART